MPVERLWEVFLDVPRWPDWNPCIWKAGVRGGELRAGAQLVWAFNPIKPAYAYKLPAMAEIVEFERCDRITWEVSLPGFHAVHAYLFAPLGEGRCRFGSWEVAEGPAYRRLRRFWNAHFRYVCRESLAGAAALVRTIARVRAYAPRVGEDFEVRTYTSADARAVLGLLEAAFGDWPGRRVAAHGRPEELFRWKHERNPHGASQIFLAEAGGRPIGMRAYMPWPLDVDGRRVDAVHTVDIATHPGHRGGGVNSELADHAVAALRETKQFALGLPNDSSASISSKSSDGRRAGRLPVWVRVRRPLRVARRLGALRSVGRSLAVPSVEAPLAAGILAAGDAVAELLHQPRPSGPHLATLTGVDYLRWRYEPLLGDYRAVSRVQRRRPDRPGHLRPASARRALGGQRLRAAGAPGRPPHGRAPAASDRPRGAARLPGRRARSRHRTGGHAAPRGLRPLAGRRPGAGRDPLLRRGQARPAPARLVVALVRRPRAPPALLKGLDQALRRRPVALDRQPPERCASARDSPPQSTALSVSGSLTSVASASSAPPRATSSAPSATSTRKRSSPIRTS